MGLMEPGGGGARGGCPRPCQLQGDGLKIGSPSHWEWEQLRSTRTTLTRGGAGRAGVLSPRRGGSAATPRKAPGAAYVAQPRPACPRGPGAPGPIRFAAKKKKKMGVTRAATMGHLAGPRLFELFHRRKVQDPSPPPPQVTAKGPRPQSADSWDLWARLGLEPTHPPKSFPLTPRPSPKPDFVFPLSPKPNQVPSGPPIAC